jgi:hypothetical protein
MVLIHGTCLSSHELGDVWYTILSTEVRDEPSKVGTWKE